MEVEGAIFKEQAEAVYEGCHSKATVMCCSEIQPDFPRLIITVCIFLGLKHGPSIWDEDGQQHTEIAIMPGRSTMPER
jgi:hypothetical protein